MADEHATYTDIGLDDDIDNPIVDEAADDSGEVIEVEGENTEQPTETPTEETESEETPIAAEGEESKPVEEDKQKQTRAERRIANLTAARKAAEEQLEVERSEYQRQLEEERKTREEYATRLAEYEQQNETAKLESLNAKRLNYLQQIEEARGDLDYEKAARLQLELDDVAQEVYRVRYQPQAAQPETPAPAPAQPQPPPAQQQPLPEEQQVWLKTNAWFANPENRKHRKAIKKANEAYQELLAEGYDPNDPEIYEELDTELKEAGFDFQRKPMQTPMVNRSSVSTGATQAPGRTGAQSRAKLTQADLQFMAMNGLNPNSQKDRRTYLNADKGWI